MGLSENAWRKRNEKKKNKKNKAKNSSSASAVNVSFASVSQANATCLSSSSASERYSTPSMVFFFLHCVSLMEFRPRFNFRTIGLIASIFFLFLISRWCGVLFLFRAFRSNYRHFLSFSKILSPVSDKNVLKCLNQSLSFSHPHTHENLFLSPHCHRSRLQATAIGHDQPSSPLPNGAARSAGPGYLEASGKKKNLWPINRHVSFISNVIILYWIY